MKKQFAVFAMALLTLAVACSDNQYSAGSMPTAPSDATALTDPAGAPPPHAQAQGRGSRATASRKLSATIEFGRDGIGSPFPPASGHDRSGHAKDSLFPREVVIDKGGTVTFKMGTSGVHQVAVYLPGTDPDDINTSLLKPPAATCPPVPLIDDPTNRVAVLSAQMCAGGSASPTRTFNTPGKYLVICTFLPHFNLRMWGWVTVRDR